VFRRILFGKLIKSIKISILTLRGKIEINRVNWLLKDIFDTLIWYVIWIGVEIKRRKLNYGCCV
jgi:hypothetical protein